MIASNVPGSPLKHCQNQQQNQEGLNVWAGQRKLGDLNTRLVLGQRQSERAAPRPEDFTPWLHTEPTTVKPGMTLSIPI